MSLRIYSDKKMACKSNSSVGHTEGGVCGLYDCLVDEANS